MLFQDVTCIYGNWKFNNSGWNILLRWKTKGNCVVVQLICDKYVSDLTVDYSADFKNYTIHFVCKY